MDTNLKTSKKIRLFLYRLLLVASIFTMGGSLWMGREAFFALKQEGKGILTGDIYYLPEFRTYISKLYTYGMIGHMGAGDDTGHPLNVTDGRRVTKTALQQFNQELAKGGSDILYHTRRNKQGKYSVNSGNVDFPLYSELDGHLMLPTDAILCCFYDGSLELLSFFDQDVYQAEVRPEQYFTYQYKPDSSVLENADFMIAVKSKETFASDYMMELQRTARAYQRFLYTFFISACVCMLSLLLNLFCFRSMRRTMKQYLAFSSHIPMECKLLLWIPLYFIGLYSHLWNWDHPLTSRLATAPFLILYGVLGAVFYLWMTDFLHNHKDYPKHSILLGFGQTVKDYLRGRFWYKRAMHLYFIYVLTGILCLLTGCYLTYRIDRGSIYLAQTASAKILYGFSVTLFLLGIAILVMGVRLKTFIKDTACISEHLSDIKAGKLQDTVPLSKWSLLQSLEADLLDIQKGMENAVEESLRSNRMRVELITNVSHDLKTPLTSIINYADLLCEEKLPGPAGEYALSLRQKAYRLKGMVQDVFELSKATSGNLPLEKTRLDLSKLMHQTLADMDERIQESTLTFKTNICDTPLIIEADGEKLYRIFQNLIVNALQYSLENSRVYIEVLKQEDNALVRIKNISRQELDFDPKEIVERFVRADASRTTEGSGLGLSIVQSFTEACGGTFSIDLNADLFTAFVSFPLSLEPLEDEKNEEDTQEK